MKTFFHSMFLLLVLFSCQNGSQVEGDPNRIIDDTATRRLNTTLKAFIEEQKAVGVSALIFEKGNEVYFNAYGFADRERNSPMDRNTIVKIYSMTKPVTGVALMKLYEEGKFQLDDPVAKYLPEFRDLQVYAGEDKDGNLLTEPPKRPMTIRDLTRHTAGFANRSTVTELRDQYYSVDAMNYDNSLSEMAEKMASVPLWFHPGEQWSYGPSVDVQAAVVERLSGKPFDEYIRQVILLPLELKETGYVVSENNRLRFATTYRRDSLGLHPMPDDENSFNSKKRNLTPGGFGLTSTIDDYMRFARMLVNQGQLDDIRILEPETIELMATNHLSDTIEERSWLPSKGQVGFGIDFAVRLRPPASVEENHGIVGEFFWDGAASTLFWVDPENELTAVFFTQMFPFAGELHKRFRDAVYGPIEVSK